MELDIRAFHARCRKACETSIKQKRCVKVMRGYYYYKGYEIKNDGYPSMPWNYYDGYGSTAVKTKAEAISYIDSETEGMNTEQLKANIII